MKMYDGDMVEALNGLHLMRVDGRWYNSAGCWQEVTDKDVYTMVRHYGARFTASQGKSAKWLKG